MRPTDTERAEWHASQSLAAATLIIDGAAEVVRLLADGVEPVNLLGYVAAQKARMDQLRTQPPPWAEAIVFDKTPTTSTVALREFPVATSMLQTRSTATRGASASAPPRSRWSNKAQPRMRRASSQGSEMGQ